MQTQPARRSDRESSLHLLLDNIPMMNCAVDRFLAMVDGVEPDVLIITELDTWWAAQLRVLNEAVYSIHYPLENTSAYPPYLGDEVLTGPSPRAGGGMSTQ
jgi:hypothetical protein